MNYSLAASFAAAAKEAIAELDHEEARLGALKDQMEALVMEAVPSAIITALGANRAAHNAHFIFPGTQSDAMLFLLDQKGVCVSAGSACQAGVLGPSHVLLGTGFSQSAASACVRVTLGKTSTFQDVQRFLTALELVHPVALQATPA